jgi:uncharacterized lipoprotein YajG
MRAHIVLAALQTQNRFTLCHLAFKSIRKLHKPSTRIQDTANDVLQRLAGAEGFRVGADSANAKSVIVSEPLAEAVDSGNAPVIFTDESPESQSEPKATNA